MSKLLVLPGARGWSSFSDAICTTSFALGSASAGAAHAKTAHSAQINATKRRDLSKSGTALRNREGRFNVPSVAGRGPRELPLADPGLGHTRGDVPRIGFARYMICYNASRNFGVPRP